MTIEEKAKRYDEALKVIKDNLDALNEIAETGAKIVNIQTIKNCFHRAFPELKENEDERIRKEIINYFQCQSRDEPTRKDIHNKWIAWLEKQGEQKPADKIEPIEWSGKINSRNAKGILKEMLDKKLLMLATK